MGAGPGFLGAVGRASATAAAAAATPALAAGFVLLGGIGLGGAGRRIGSGGFRGRLDHQAALAVLTGTVWTGALGARVLLLVLL